MTPVLLLRHGRTAWNEERRIQGRRDVALSAAGRAALHGRRVPAAYRAAQWYASPLRRALETAALLGGPAPRVEPRLMELDWGRWEGRTRAELTERYGERMAENEARGLDFRPLGGESPRELRVRLRAWLEEVGAPGEPVVAVTHKGVVQMALALATGWDLVSRAPHKLDWTRAHLFRYDGRAARLHVGALNIELEHA